MPVILPCVKCKRKLRVLDRLLGKLIKCPACQTKFVASVSGAAALATASSVSRGGAAPGSGRTAPKSQPPSRPLAAPASRTKAPASPAPSSARSRTVPKDLAVEQGEDEFMAGPAAPMPRSGPRLDHIEATSPKSAKRRPKPSSFVSVFVTLGLILLGTAALGLVCAYLVNSKIQSYRGRKAELNEHHLVALRK